jgi:hypothetical protein
MPTLGVNAVFKLDNSGGSLVDLSQYVTSVSGLPGDADLQDVTTFGSAGKKWLPGIRNAEISVEGIWDATVDAHFAAIIGSTATQTFEYGPEGGTAGKVKYTGECRVASYTTSGGVGEPVGFSATLRVDGAITRTTF